MLVMQSAKCVEKLDRVYCCSQCSAIFLFRSDVEDHDRIFGHKEMTVMPL